MTALGITRRSTGYNRVLHTLPIIGGGGIVIVFGAVFSTLTALNAVVIASSRVAFSMGRDGNFLRQFGQLHSQFGTPHVAVVASMVVMVIAILFLPIRQVGNLSSLFFLLSFIVVNGSVIKLRRERPSLQRPFEMPLYPIPPVLGIVCNLALGVFISWQTWVIGIGWILVGGGVYLVMRRRQSERSSEGRKAGGGLPSTRTESSTPSNRR